MDFTVKIYKQLLNQLIASGYHFQTFSEFLNAPEERVIILRHDVDDKKLNSLYFSEIQNKAGVKGTYFFRMVPQSFDEEVILKIANLGHEIGYHYEDMDMAGSKFGVRSSKLKEEELYDAALQSFEENLKKLRKLYPVRTICMHGSPRSRFDNKAIWIKNNYRDFGIIGEPYFDIDFNEVLYLTDTGRRWDGDKVSVRDKVQSLRFKIQDSKNKINQDLTKFSFYSTTEIILSAVDKKLPDKIMFTFHPQRWTDKIAPWIKELVLQNIKNQIKRFYINQT